ncbi:hypothetical protein LIER_42968 [Lithospermum erythrorhizon]|uniref:carotenoid 9,10-dioxygenase n=1 Tax=Lithospermum erythrorhizon TaxID=34254 RepID=A0AAV3PCN3_LITER
MSAEQAENDSIPISKYVLLCRSLVSKSVTLSFPGYKFTFDLKTGEATQEIVSENKIDYTKIKENYTKIKKSRYVYASGFDKIEKAVAVLKYDLEAEPQKRVTTAEFGGNIFGSEVVFVPSKNANEEDDSYLLTYVHDETNGGYTFH